MHDDLSKQYLKAMGVTIWEPRELDSAETTADGVPLQPTAQPPVPSPAQQPITETATTAQSPVKPSLPVAVSSATQDYLSALGNTPVSLTQTRQGDLLLVLEPPLLSAEDTSLLTAMLKAINYDISQQSLACMDLTATETLSAVLPMIKPKLVIIMAVHNGNAALLDNHRAGVHRAEWSTVPLAITIHPKELIADAANKRPAWEDLKQVKAHLDA